MKKTFLPSYHFIPSPNKELPTECTFTRASSAYRTTENGLLELVNSDVIRHDYDPVTGEYLGVLLENESTNMLGSFDTASFVSGRAYRTVTSIEAPDGSTNKVIKVTESTDLGTHYFTTPVTTSFYCPNLVPGEYFTFSFFVKAGERSEIQVSMQSYYAAIKGYDSQVYFQLNIETGYILAGPILYKNTYLMGDVSCTIFANPKVKVIKYPNHWRRVCLTAQLLNNAQLYNQYDTVTIRPIIYLINTSSNESPGARATSYVGTLNCGIYLWGAQLEQTDNATSYIPTTTARVTRAADDLRIDISDSFRTDEGTIITEFDINSFPKQRPSTLTTSRLYPGDTIYQSVFNIHDSVNIDKRIVNRLSASSIISRILSDINGTASRGTLTSLTDNNKLWATNQCQSAKLTITAGTGLGCIATIASNTDSTLTYSSPTLTPDNTTAYRLLAESGQAEKGTTTTLTDSTKSWTTNQWQNYKLKITGGTVGVGTELTILSNTTWTLTFTAAGFVPNNTTLYEINFPGVATSGSTNVLIDSGQAWTTNQWATKKLTISAGKGLNCTSTISSNTSTSLTFSTPIFIPDTTTKYRIDDITQLSIIDTLINIDKLKYIQAFAYTSKDSVLISDGNNILESNDIIDCSSITDAELSFNYLYKDTVWGSAINLIQSPKSFNNTNWTKTNVILDPTYNFPFIKNVMLSRFFETATTGLHYVTLTNAITVTTHTDYVLRLVLKMEGRTTVGVYVATIGLGKYINLSSGAIGNNILVAPTSCTAVRFDSTSWLVTMQFNTGANSSLKMHVLSDNGTTPSDTVGATYPGDITKGFQVGGIQLCKLSQIDYDTQLKTYSLNGHLKKVYYYKARLPNSKLKELTT